MRCNTGRGGVSQSPEEAPAGGEMLCICFGWLRARRSRLEGGTGAQALLQRMVHPPLGAPRRRRRKIPGHSVSCVAYLAAFCKRNEGIKAGCCRNGRGQGFENATRVLKSFGKPNPMCGVVWEGLGVQRRGNHSPACPILAWEGHRAQQGRAQGQGFPCRSGRLSRFG